MQPEDTEIESYDFMDFMHDLYWIGVGLLTLAAMAAVVAVLSGIAVTAWNDGVCGDSVYVEHCTIFRQDGNK